MRNRSFEEKQLSQKMFDLENISCEISIELDEIFRELDRKGKWDEFMVNLDRIHPNKKYCTSTVKPENYYESLHFAFDMMSKHDELKEQVELAATEADLLKGRGMEAIEMPSEILACLETAGISLKPGVSDAPPIRNEKYPERVALFQLKGRRILRLMEKALDTLKLSKSFIFSKY